MVDSATDNETCHLEQVMAGWKHIADPKNVVLFFLNLKWIQLKHVVNLFFFGGGALKNQQYTLYLNILKSPQKALYKC